MAAKVLERKLIGYKLHIISCHISLVCSHPEIQQNPRWVSLKLQVCCWIAASPIVVVVLEMLPYVCKVVHKFLFKIAPNG